MTKRYILPRKGMTRWGQLLWLLLYTLAGWAQAPVWKPDPKAVPELPPPSWSWVQWGSSAPHTPTTSVITGMATNAAGDIFVTGSFTEKITIGTTELLSAGREDIFLAKWHTREQRWAWAVRGGGTSVDKSGGVAINGDCIYLVGSFNSNSHMQIAGQALDTGSIFVAKFLDQGHEARGSWAVSAGLCPFGCDQGAAITVQGRNVYITGLFNGPETRIAGATLQGAGNTDMFVAKYVDQGATVENGWAVSGGGVYHDRGTSIAVVGHRVYVTGDFKSDGQAMIAGTSLAGAGDYDMYLATYVDEGASCRNGGAIAEGGEGAEAGFALAATDSCVYVAGYFGDRARIATTLLTSAGNSDIFVAKYFATPHGPVGGWAARGGGEGTDLALGLAISGRSVYVAGQFMDVLPGITPSLDLPTGGGYNLFVRRYTDAGRQAILDWTANSTYNTSSFYRSSVVVQGSRVMVAGQGSSTIRFGTLSPTRDKGDNMYFLAQLVEAPFVAATGTVVTAPTNFSRVAPLTLSVYPNPATANFTVQCSAVPATATLYDAVGRVVGRHTLTQLLTTLDVHSLEAGVYVLRIQAAGHTATQRVSLQ